MIKLEEKLKQLQANWYMLQLYMETHSKTFSDNLWSFGWPWLGTHVYKMAPTALDYHSILHGAHRSTSIRRTNRRFSVKLVNYREEGVIYRSEKLVSSRFTYITFYGQRKSEQQEIAIKQRSPQNILAFRRSIAVDVMPIPALMNSKWLLDENEIENKPLKRQIERLIENPQDVMELRNHVFTGDVDNELKIDWFSIISQKKKGNFVITTSSNRYCFRHLAQSEKGIRDPCLESTNEYLPYRSDTQRSDRGNEDLLGDSKHGLEGDSPGEVAFV
ncbi:hypothetical protein TNCV_1089071 [Trichonephila clavipes]|uniref:Uncharacterized protein n=1 Tax=Trichonephila clavipes TaxID=2585209 RepID=A0A8X6SRV2_TRICX|nr:hypothetical protein TNCV_1089071 [Trichonephila clavipes]